VGDATGCCCRWWGWRSRSVEYTTRSSERVCTFSCSFVVSAVDGLCTSFAAWLAVSEVVVVVWVLDTALDVVSEVVVAGNAGVGGCDVAVARGVSGHNGRGWG
jgi:hypothetical protein